MNRKQDDEKQKRLFRGIKGLVFTSLSTVVSSDKEHTDFFIPVCLITFHADMGKPLGNSINEHVIITVRFT